MEQFNYTYKAPTEEERKEIAGIRRQYEKTPEKSESKLERLRSLDARVKNSAFIFSLTFGVIGCLVFGTGLALALEWGRLFWGIAVGIIGCLPMLLAYPAYKFLLNRNKKKYGAEILKLSEELLNEE